MSRELDVQVADKIFGGRYIINHPTHGTISLSPCSSDLNAAYEVEEKIREMGLDSDYIENLIIIVDIDSEAWDSFKNDFIIVHATAEQRCLAAIRAVEGVNKC